MQSIFITGIGTGIGKTLVASIVTEALQAYYWKPIQAGVEHGTDTDWVKANTSRPPEFFLPETYKLAMAASPHIAAREEGISVDLDTIAMQYEQIVKTIPATHTLVIEGAGGLFVPLNETQFVLDLVKRLNATVILVSRNYLGSINHSLLTAAACRSNGLKVAGWIFNDQYLHYEQEIVQWSSCPSIYSIPFQNDPGKEFV